MLFGLAQDFALDVIRSCKERGSKLKGDTPL